MLTITSALYNRQLNFATTVQHLLILKPDKILLIWIS